MRDTFMPRVGGILSADIAVPEHEREVHFYSRVLTTGEYPLWREDLMNNQGTPIVGLGERCAEYAQLPLQWMPHIQVADVEVSVKRAIDLGGSNLMQDENNQWAVLLDPNGAAFGIIPVVSEEAVPQTGAAVSVGHICGIKLTVDDAATTCDFYRQVIGWSVQEVEMNDANEPYTDFTMHGNSGHSEAEICHARGVNLDLSPIWIISLPVGDLAESIRRVKGEGGKIIKMIRKIDGMYVSAVIEDLVGAQLALVPL